MHLVTYRFASLLGLSAVLALMGCNQVLGIDDHPLAAGAGGRSVTASGGAAGAAGGRSGGAGHGATAGTGGSSGMTTSSTGGVGGEPVGAGATAGKAVAGSSSQTAGQGGSPDDLGGQGGEAPKSDPCDPNPCQNNGACNGDGTCNCQVGFSGAKCETQSDPCATNPCLNGGACSNVSGDYSCACQPGYEGKTCETNHDDCSPEPCLNGGTCEDGLNTYTCHCPSGFSGTTCERAVHGCSDMPCLNGATCTDTGALYTCACVLGYSGTNCETNINDCSPNPCLNGGSCTDGVATHTCSCIAGYSGTNCETNIDDCSPNPCLNGGTCTDGVNSHACSCKAGYSGTNCETNIDDCSPNPCVNGGTCTDGVAMYTCSCTSGWTGKTCSTHTPPTVVSVSPASNAKNVEPDVSSITIGFSEAMQASSITTSTVQVLLNGTAISGTVSYSGTTATFTPGVRLTLLGEYTVKVSQSVTDTYGGNMAADFTSIFDVRDGAFGTPKVISACAGNYLNAASDAQGNILVVCSPSTAGVYATWYHPSRAGSAEAWGTTTQLDTCSSSLNCYGARVAVNATGTAVVAYLVYNPSPPANTPYYTYKARQYRNGAWESASTNMVQVWDSGDFTVGVGPAGDTHVAVSGATTSGNNDVLTTLHNDGSGWSAAVGDTYAQVASGTTLNMAFTSAGNGFLLWRTLGNPNYTIRTARYSASGKAWGQDTDIPGVTESGGGGLNPPGLAVDASGNAMMACSYVDPVSTGGEMASRFTAAAGWSSGAAIDNIGYQELDDGLFTGLVYDGTDFIASWMQTTAQGGGLLNAYSNRYHNGAWGTAQLVNDGIASVNPNGVAVAADNNGHSIIAWGSEIGTTSNYTAYYSRYANGAWGNATQVFTQPAQWGMRLVGGANGVAGLTTSYVPSTGANAVFIMVPFK